MRVGYKSDPEGDIEAITAGGGFDLSNFVNQEVTFDYANVPQSQRGRTVTSSRSSGMKSSEESEGMSERAFHTRRRPLCAFSYSRSFWL